LGTAPPLPVWQNDLVVFLELGLDHSGEYLDSFACFLLPFCLDMPIYRHWLRDYVNSARF